MADNIREYNCEKKIWILPTENIRLEPSLGIMLAHRVDLNILVTDNEADNETLECITIRKIRKNEAYSKASE